MKPARPVKPAPTPETRTGGGGAPAAADILIVDDHAENLLALETVLAPLGQRIARAGSGREALRRCLEREFAVILLDVQMPDLDGFETAALIRERDSSRQTPIIFLTAISKSDAFVFKGYSHGAVDYMFKPFVPDVLRAKVAVFVDLFLKTAQLREQAARLEAMNRELTRSNDELQQFAYVASHDLREPLRKVSSFADLLARRLGAKLDASSKQYLDFMVDGVTRMQAMIDDLLDYSRAGRADRPLARAALGGIVSRVLDDLSPEIRAQKAKVTVERLPELDCDPAQIARLFQNLVANALKFKGDKALAVHIGAEKARGEWRFFVRDTGIGIDPAYHDRIFAIFKRLHSREQYPGSGIGLAVCKKIVEFHGGRIWVESRAGEGATFCFTLPQREP